MSLKGAAAIESAIRAANAEGRPALIAYLTAGYPAQSSFVQAIIEVAAVADVVEIGVPFSDPMADGATIQRASRTALARGANTFSLLESLRARRAELKAPIALMSYLNPLIALGLDGIGARLADAGVDGLIAPDLPFEESAGLRADLADFDLALIPMISPLTTPDRVERLCGGAGGFVYAVAMLGVTGGAARFDAQAISYLERARSISPAPVCAGFGVRTEAQVRDIAAFADGVVIGSKLIELMENGESPATFLSTLRRAFGV